MELLHPRQSGSKLKSLIPRYRKPTDRQLKLSGISDSVATCVTYCFYCCHCVSVWQADSETERWAFQNWWDDHTFSYTCTHGLVAHCGSDIWYTLPKSKRWQHSLQQRIFICHYYQHEPSGPSHSQRQRPQLENPRICCCCKFFSFLRVLCKL